MGDSRVHLYSLPIVTCSETGHSTYQVCAPHQFLGKSLHLLAVASKKLRVCSARSAPPNR